MTGRFEDICDTNDRLFRVDNAEINNRIYFDGYVIARDDVLRRYVHDDNAEIHFGHFLQAGDQDDQAGALHRLEATEEEYDATLILFENLDRVVQDDDDQR